MKKYVVEFYRQHSRLSNVYVKTTFQAQDLERALSRVKKDLHRLDLIPKVDPGYSNFIMSHLEEKENALC